MCLGGWWGRSIKEKWSRINWYFLPFNVQFYWSNNVATCSNVHPINCWFMPILPRIANKLDTFNFLFHVNRLLPNWTVKCVTGITGHKCIALNLLMANKLMCGTFWHWSHSSIIEECRCRLYQVISITYYTINELNEISIRFLKTAFCLGKLLSLIMVRLP